jgi:hypothetical protein
VVERLRISEKRAADAEATCKAMEKAKKGRERSERMLFQQLTGSKARSVLPLTLTLALDPDFGHVQVLALIWFRASALIWFRVPGFGLGFTLGFGLALALRWPFFCGLRPHHFRKLAEYC